MLFIKSKISFIIGLLLFIAMFYFKMALGDSIIRPLGFVLSGVIMGYALENKEKDILHL
ncbi:hypothetical protein [Staphylococcus intermedius]|uniref:Phage protein n=2 Tax=Staphylococcus intermedius TaxID=1285 RepID=A0A380G658_STAIN|nr:hypothetical protein [Staphylococcus intermedius]SUM46242.1 Uncharacterised protein [Staphylococcus intermedius NCTC 11048]